VVLNFPNDNSLRRFGDLSRFSAVPPRRGVTYGAAPTRRCFDRTLLIDRRRHPGELVRVVGSLALLAAHH
jgi:hypothetical protein